VLVEHWESARKTKADWANVGVRFVAVSSAAGTEHFTLGSDLAVNFEADGCDVVFSWHECEEFEIKN
jgi:hypothetical protein